MAENGEDPSGAKEVVSSGNLIGAGLIAGALIGGTVGAATDSIWLSTPIGIAIGLIGGWVLHNSRSTPAP